MALHRRHLVVLSTVLALCFSVSSCGDDAEDLSGVAQAGPTPFDLDAAQIGVTRSAYGTVTDTLSANSFTLVDVLVSGDRLLVISPDAVALRPGFRVTVTGTIEQFEDDSVSRFGLDGADLPPVEAGERFLLADSVDAPITGTDGS